MTDLALSALPTNTGIITSNGTVWQISDPKAEDVDWFVIAESLSKISRWNGHTPGHIYSVAQHCCQVCDALDAEAKPYGLLHDAHEAYIGDVTRPLKLVMEVYGAGPAWRLLEQRHDSAIYKAAGIPHPSQAILDRVAAIDDRALATEARDLLAPDAHRLDLHSFHNQPPFPKAIECWPWARAADEFLARCRDLLPGAQATP